MRIFILTLFLSLLLTSIAQATDYSQDLNDFINIEIKSWINNDIVIDYLKNQNEKNSTLLESDLKILDNKWQSEARKVNQVLISQVVNNDLSQFLKKIQTTSQGVYTEISIIDNKGLCVGQSITSEHYWYGEEKLWGQTFKTKSYSTYISDIYYSDTTNKFQVQIAFMIISDEQPIGVITAGIDVEQLEDWKKRK